MSTHTDLSLMSQVRAWHRIHKRAVELGWYDEYCSKNNKDTWLDFLLEKMETLHKQSEYNKGKTSSKDFRISIRNNGDFDVTPI